MRDLPRDRLPKNISHPFVTIRVDYLGPFPVRNRRSHEKRYILLFTCLVTRPVHTEATETLSTEDALLAVQRFISRRRLPDIIQSDNDTIFIGAKNTLKSELEKLQNQASILQDRRLLKGITWVFNPPSVPHFGRPWERLIRVFKDTFFKIAGTRQLTPPTLETLTIEIENIMNNRHLTTVSSDHRDDEPLTPNHFFPGRPTNITPSANLDTRNLNQDQNCNWRVSQQLLNNFWERFMRESLPNLTTRSKWTKTCPNLEEGDLVWLLEDFTPRGLWPMGRVKSTIEGSNGVVRSCEISTIYGTSTRPVNRLSKSLDLWFAGSEQTNLIFLPPNGAGYVNESLTFVNYSLTDIVNQLKSDCICDSCAVLQDAPKEVFT